MSIKNKKEFVRQKVIQENANDRVKCTKLLAFIDKLEEANIPIGYWFLTMNNFYGPEKLKEITDDYINNLHNNYMNCKSICFAGNQGIGKTLSSICILKKALKTNFSAFYITAPDMLSEITNYKNSEIRQKLKDVDFLFIDELDSRFFVSDSVKELFSGIYENIFRYRSHNTLPTIICTNETENFLNVFYGQSVQAIKSLNDQYLSIYSLIGKDYRKEIK